jgi:hypothetical protein
VNTHATRKNVSICDGAFDLPLSVDCVMPGDYRISVVTTPGNREQQSDETRVVQCSQKVWVQLQVSGAARLLEAGRCLSPQQTFSSKRPLNPAAALPALP